MAYGEAKGFDLGNLIDAFNKKKDGFLPCVFDGSFCSLKEEICSLKTKTCFSIFAPSDNEEEKDKRCWEIMKGNMGSISNIEGQMDVCYYRFGYRIFSAGNGSLNLISTDETKSAPWPSFKSGKEFCPYDKSYCQRDSEICSEDTLSCMAVLEKSLPDEAKTVYCQDVLKSKNLTIKGLRDVCLYFLGAQFATGKMCLGNCDRNSESSDTAIGLPIGICSAVVIVIAAVVVFLTWKKKWLCCQRVLNSEKSVDSSKKAHGDSNSAAAEGDVNSQQVTGGDPIEDEGKPTRSDPDKKGSTKEERQELMADHRNKENFLDSGKKADSRGEKSVDSSKKAHGDSAAAEGDVNSQQVTGGDPIEDERKPTRSDPDKEGSTTEERQELMADHRNKENFLDSGKKADSRGEKLVDSSKKADSPGDSNSAAAEGDVNSQQVTGGDPIDGNSAAAEGAGNPQQRRNEKLEADAGTLDGDNCGDIPIHDAGELGVTFYSTEGTELRVSNQDSELIGSDFDREQLIKDFEKRKDGFFPCVYDGTYCNMREEICSVKTKTCHRIFNIPEGTSYSEEQKDKECLEIIKGNTHGKIEGVNDVCFYRLGYRLYCSNCSELDGGLISTDKMRSNYKTGKEFCPYDMSYCQRDKEICSKEKRSCKAVLEASASEESKRLYCEEVLKSKQETVEGLKDVCRYYIGTLVASGKICLRNCDRDSGSSSSIIGKAVGISIGVITMVVIVALVVGLLLAKKKKKWCFSESSETPIPGRGNKKQPDAMEPMLNVKPRAEGETPE